MYIKCQCQNCGNYLEFESEGVGLTVECPHCGTNTQLYIPQTKLETAQSSAKNKPPTQSFSRKRAGFYLAVLIIAFTCFTAYKFHTWMTDRLQRRNEIAAIAAKKVRAESERAAEQAKLNEYLFIHRYSDGAESLVASRSFEENQIDKYGSRLSCEYTISYNNPTCLSIGRSVTIHDGDQISTDMSDYDDLHGGSYVYQDYYEDKYKGRTDMVVNVGVQSGRTVNILELQDKVLHYRDYKNFEEGLSTEFKILRKDSDEITNWISKYQKWCKIAQSEHLAVDVTNKISAVCVHVSEHDDQVDMINMKDVEFVTPNILRIGDGEWSDNEVAKLEKLLSMIPDLDADLKSRIAASQANKTKEEHEVANQNQLRQLRQNEENRAKALLQ